MYFLIVFSGAVPNDEKWSSMWHMEKLQMSDVWDLISYSQTLVKNIVRYYCSLII